MTMNPSSYELGPLSRHLQIVSDHSKYSDEQALPISNASAAPIKETPAFPSKPSTPQAATTYSLFSSPDRFSLPHIYNNVTHYLTDSLAGKLWWDVNGDGKRGDYANATLNDMEYDYGIPQVKNIRLVTCLEANLVDLTMSQPVMGGSTGSNAPQRQSLNFQAGRYAFELSHVPPGRYYIVYSAPKDYRITGNVLPLRKGETINSECEPYGGEGDGFGDRARTLGDFDSEGYCARTIGCFEVGQRTNLTTKFKKWTDWKDEEVMGDATNSLDYSTGNGKFVALPSPYALDVGLAQEQWDLPVQQFADATITLTFPRRKTTNGQLQSEALSLADEFATLESFGKSENKQVMTEVLKKFFQEGYRNNSNGDGSGQVNTSFTLSGLDLFEAKIDSSETKTAPSEKRNLRHNTRRTLENQEKGGKNDTVQVTYTFTARGSYKPPPHDQLGYFVKDSINDDPTNLVRTLREDKNLPFSELEDANAEHLTVGPPSPKKRVAMIPVAYVIEQSSDDRLTSGTKISVIVLSLLIIILTLLFFFRRLFYRRRKIASKSSKSETLSYELKSETLSSKALKKKEFKKMDSRGFEDSFNSRDPRGRRSEELVEEKDRIKSGKKKKKKKKRSDKRRYSDDQLVYYP